VADLENRDDFQKSHDVFHIVLQLIMSQGSICCS